MSTIDELHEARLAMAGLGDHVDIFREWATGYRQTLVRDGWSETQAERVAADALVELFRKVMR